jgi:cation:H+ antiporter
MTGVPIGLVLAGSAVGVAASAQLFTHGVEWLGFRLRLGYRAAGGLLAAWGTALPETLIPLVALARGGRAGQDVGVGAILGAPFLLATLAFAVIGAAVALRTRAGRPAYLNVAPGSASTDLAGFVILFAVALAAGLVPGGAYRTGAALALALGYAAYVAAALGSGRASGPMARPARFLWLSPAREPGLAACLGAALAGLVGLLAGAHGFVVGVTDLGHGMGVSHLLLAVVLAPLATELPEVLNSAVWVARGQDGLALTAVTGAMTFQATVGPLLGMALTPWQLGGPERFAGALALGAALFFAVGIRLFRRLEAGPLLFGAAFYAIFVVAIAAG